jgi:hypothetical protein
MLLTIIELILYDFLDLSHYFEFIINENLLSYFKIILSLIKVGNNIDKNLKRVKVLFIANINENFIM